MQFALQTPEEQDIAQINDQLDRLERIVDEIADELVRLGLKAPSTRRLHS